MSNQWLCMLKLPNGKYMFVEEFVTMYNTYGNTNFFYDPNQPIRHDIQNAYLAYQAFKNAYNTREDATIHAYRLLNKIEEDCDTLIASIRMFNVNTKITEINGIPSLSVVITPVLSK